MSNDQPRQRGRALGRRSVLRRAELAVLIALVVVWSASIFVWPSACWSSRTGMRFVSIASGGVDLFRYPKSDLPGGLVVSSSAAGNFSILWWPRRITPIGGFGLSVPIWFLFPIPLLPAMIRLAVRASTPAYRCRWCRYDLRGLGPDRSCPECGEARMLSRIANLQTGS